jgi:acyl-coenzyme A thioesterase PaaI-like protein
MARMADGPSLQERYAPESICFGCGPANPDGLHIRSRREADETVADWMPSPQHQAFPGVLNGGIIGTLMDCHSNWTAAEHLMRSRGVDRPPTTVTADFHVFLRRPTPSDRPLHLRARVVESSEDRATVEAELSSGGTVTATCRATFVAVGPGHPAYNRW